VGDAEAASTLNTSRPRAVYRARLSFVLLRLPAVDPACTRRIWPRGSPRTRLVPEPPVLRASSRGHLTDRRSLTIDFSLDGTTRRSTSGVLYATRAQNKRTKHVRQRKKRKRRTTPAYAAYRLVLDTIAPRASTGSAYCTPIPDRHVHSTNSRRRLARLASPPHVAAQDRLPRSLFQP